MWLVLSYGPKSLYFIIILHTFHYTSGQGYLDILNHTVLKWQSKPSLFAHIKSSQHLWLALFLHLPMPTSDLLTLNYSCSEGGTSLLSVLEAPTSPGAIPTWNAVPGSVNWLPLSEPPSDYPPKTVSLLHHHTALSLNQSNSSEQFCFSTTQLLPSLLTFSSDSQVHMLFQFSWSPHSSAHPIVVLSLGSFLYSSPNSYTLLISPIRFYLIFSASSCSFSRAFTSKGLVVLKMWSSSYTVILLMTWAKLAFLS